MASKTYGPDDQLLLFFSMHGYFDEAGEAGCLCPAGSKTDDPAFDTWLLHTELRTVIDQDFDSVFYVIAGSFPEEERAKYHMTTLKSVGYSTTQIVRFPNSPYYSVCVDIFSSRKEANAFKRKLEEANIDAFVRIVPKTK